LHGDGSDPALLQPSGHGLEFGGGASELPYRLAISAWRYCYVVRFVADINPWGIGMDLWFAKILSGLEINNLAAAPVLL
jgi:hypothetical protein